MQGCIASFILYILVAQSAPTARAKAHSPHRYITRCTYDSQNFSLRDAPAQTILEPLNDVEVHARRPISQVQGATFVLTKARKTIGTIVLADLFNPNGWITPSPDWKRFAITWSDGGGGGDWHTRIFHFAPNGRFAEDRRAMAAVEADFRPRHSCEERGDNFDAIRWMDNDHLLLEASVYNSSACGAEMAFTEGYLLRASSDSIEQHFSEQQLIDLPQVCTVNSSPEDDSPVR